MSLLWFWHLCYVDSSLHLQFVSRYSISSLDVPFGDFELLDESSCIFQVHIYSVAPVGLESVI